MTTTRRIDKTRRPPRRPPVRAAARTDDPAKSSEAVAVETAPAEIAAAPPMPEIAAAEPLLAEIAAAEPLLREHSAAEPLLAGTSTVAMLAADIPVAAPVLADAPETLVASDEAERTGGATMAEASPEVAAAGTDPVPASEEPAEAPVTAAETLAEAPAIEESEIEAPSSEDHAAEAPTMAEPAVPEPVASAPPADAAAPAEPGPGAAPGQAGREEIPLAAMQGFIEINGRLVAFFQGESQAALAFWKSAFAARSPSDLAQLQAAEMSRAVDAALACWTDLARRMGRLPAFTAPRADAA